MELKGCAVHRRMPCALDRRSGILQLSFETYEAMVISPKKRRWYSAWRATAASRRSLASAKLCMLRAWLISALSAMNARKLLLGRRPQLCWIAWSACSRKYAVTSAKTKRCLARSQAFLSAVKLPPRSPSSSSKLTLHCTATVLVLFHGCGCKIFITYSLMAASMST